jgi:gamma-glutamyltranspeptidase/glutathione hydrolase
MRIAVAGANQLTADAAAELGAAGGNAVDACVAAALVAMLTEVGVCALGAGGFVTVWTAEGNPVTIDGYMEMPGRGLPPDAFGGGDHRVQMDYGGGLETIIGAGSVATPGGLAALAKAVDLFGTAPWSEVMGPVQDVARNGFPLSGASDFYFSFAAEAVFGVDPRSRAVVIKEDGTWLRKGETVLVPDLAPTLEAIAAEGADLFYRGEVGAMISDHLLANGGILTRQDLEEYEARLREPIHTLFDGWEVATNPGPAIGGAATTAMLRLAGPRCFDLTDAEHVDRAIAAQRAVMRFRRSNLDGSDHPDVDRLLALSAAGSWDALMGSPSTIHVSAVDAAGTACSITMSAGYGSGVIAPGTGIWLNNSLGEIELNAAGYHAQTPGTRLVSNMAPTVARDTEGDVLAIGTPGADRITTALQLTLLGYLHGGHALEEAVAAPRLHVELGEGDEYSVAHEPGVAVSDGHVVRPFDDLSMYFGGVTAAVRRADGSLVAAADPRRDGSVVVL